MPTVLIEMFNGRTPAQKEALVAEVTTAVVNSLSVDPELVKIKIYEIEPWHAAQGGRLKAPPPAPTRFPTEG